MISNILITRLKKTVNKVVGKESVTANFKQDCWDVCIYSYRKENKTASIHIDTCSGQKVTRLDCMMPEEIWCVLATLQFIDVFLLTCVGRLYFLHAVT